MNNKIEKIARKSLSFISPYVPGKPEEQLFREKGLLKVIKLASNENPFGASPFAIKAIKNRARTINRYPEGSAFALKEKLSRTLGVNMQQIIVGSGSSEIISLTIQSFCEPGDEVIFATPSFVIYRILAHAFGAIPIEVKLNPDFSYNLNAYLESISKRTKLLILCNPNNPTGTYIKKQELEWLIKNVPDNVIILSDEAYVEYVEADDFGSAFQWLGKENMIIARTFSKVYGLAGLRIGYGIASPDIIGIMEKIRPPFNTSSLAQDAAIAALDDTDFVKKSIYYNKKEKIYLFENLKRLGFTVFHSEANFLFCRTEKNITEICEKLEENGVIIRPVDGFDPNWNYMRITIGKPSENRFLIKQLKKIC
ncbi:MAG TPA: histidinol-phosphate transaminase [Candidatus Ratteibacteria bacterium]|uniref:Histidinol-phosphate aminotransferase n=1 Tax=candidate division TA06 bacterium ADurb.Bin131 TaxID=1852827 RepID=A0A1V6C435_UNCT6|nr:MAG: Histidinol-phosphate aminotransferase 2 [candidate division TA06 bacterium ADurb.Bin131]HOC02069.1 histidinol-phosphate transaminase [bacterium]HRS06807.1 histidinol-phosphate transaminase [Candidatus Ratteibacteria bacterium]HON04986.1 histidinol-phosphate transaminase [bacterium]HPC30246.1 histidinol-phosphate transaminase [bacterium]